MIPVADIIRLANTTITTSNPIQTAQILGVYDAINNGGAATVANVSSLPDASLNKGRMFYVCDIGGYRYSDGLTWTNNFDTTLVSNQIYGFGSNIRGVLGTNDNIGGYYSVPVQEFTGANTWYSVTTSGSSTYAIKGDGTLWGWGRNDFGQLGDGSYVDRYTPVQEYSQSTNWCRVYNTGVSGVGIKSDGTLWSWGSGINGVLGDNTTATKNTPVQEYTGSTNWISAGATNDSVSAIKSDGTLWSWGQNTYGQLGDGTTVAKCTPTQESTLSTNWCALSYGGISISAIKTDGSLWSWGRNLYGQLADNTIVDKCTPTREVTSSSNWKCVSGVGNTMTAIKTNGTLWSWGYGLEGQIGNNSDANRSSPVQEITSSTTWCFISGTKAIKKDGSLWAWGLNSCGQLGDGTITNRSSPVRESTLSNNWSSVSSAGSVTIGLKTVTTRGFFGQP